MNDNQFSLIGMMVIKQHELLLFLATILLSLAITKLLLLASIVTDSAHVVAPLYIVFFIMTLNALHMVMIPFK
jgi:hypothetical protein